MHPFKHEMPAVWRCNLELCHSFGERRPFVPPFGWESLEEEIAALRATPIAK